MHKQITVYSSGKSLCLSPTVCLLRADPGPCSEAVERYYFNTDTSTCEAFMYGGCAGNGNNFETLEECTKECDVKQNLKKTEL